MSAVRPSSLRRLRSAVPTADHSTSPTKRKTDDCTPLQSSASLISSVPHRHQTCRAESSKAAHFPDKSAQSAAYSRSAAHGPSDMAFSQYQMCLRPTPQPPPDHWSAPAPPFAAPESSASATSHPKLPVLRPRRFGAAPTQVQHIRNPPRTGTSPSRRGERHHHTHSRLHPASRAATVSERGRCALPSTDPPPKAEDRRRSPSMSTGGF